MTNQSGENLEQQIRRETREAIVSSTEDIPLFSTTLLQMSLLLAATKDAKQRAVNPDVGLLKAVYAAALDEALTIATSPAYVQHHATAEYVASILANP